MHQLPSKAYSERMTVARTLKRLPESSPEEDSGALGRALRSATSGASVACAGTSMHNICSSSGARPGELAKAGPPGQTLAGTAGAAATAPAAAGVDVASPPRGTGVGATPARLAVCSSVLSRFEQQCHDSGGQACCVDADDTSHRTKAPWKTCSVRGSSSQATTFNEEGKPMQSGHLGREQHLQLTAARPTRTSAPAGSGAGAARATLGAAAGWSPAVVARGWAQALGRGRAPSQWT